MHERIILHNLFFAAANPPAPPANLIGTKYRKYTQKNIATAEYKF
ncbi:MAG: hypothetical protein ABH872_03250 [Candidatus Omnitrophota bacterium]